MSHFQPVCRVDEVPPGEARMFSVGETVIGLFHINEGFYAISNACPHAGASLAHGLLDGDVVSCRIHHWRFCLRDGRYLDEDRPEMNVATFPTKVINGEVLINVDAADSTC